MDAAQWPQGTGGVGRPVEYSRDVDVDVEKRPRPHEALNCPRCNSTNTKFCYYNNYSLSQPRYFCKTCRRYWTAGGTLRNVPVGGSSRKNMKRSSSSTSSKKFVPDLSLLTQNPKIHDGQDPPIYYGIPFALQPQNPNSSVFKAGGGLGLSSSSAVSNSNSSGFPMHDLKPGLSYCQDELELGNRFGNLRSTVDESKTIFPFEEARADANDNENENGLQQNGYWSGMLSGGPW